MNGVVDYFEIGSPDPESTKAFYGQLFGWEIGEPSEQDYRPISEPLRPSGRSIILAQA